MQGCSSCTKYCVLHKFCRILLLRKLFCSKLRNIVQNWAKLVAYDAEYCAKLVAYDAEYCAKLVSLHTQMMRKMLQK